MSFEDLKKRTVVAVVAVCLVAALLATSFMSPYGTLVLSFAVLCLALICGFELASFACFKNSQKVLGLRLILVTALAPAILIALAPYFNLNDIRLGLPAVFLSLLLAILSALIFTFLLSRSGLADRGKHLLDCLLGILLVGLGSACLVALSALNGREALFVWLMAVVFSNDIGAYFIGLRLRGPKISPQISPNKTISGAIGGLLSGAIVGVALSPTLPVLLSFREAFVVSICIVIAAQLGDLTKSFLKRLYSVKDTGKIMPGHGGLLDRIDGLLMGATAFYTCLALLL